MTCDDVELELSAPEPSAEARAHAEGCARCRQTLEVLGLARLPELSAAERDLLAVLPAATEAAARTQARAGGPGRQVASLLLAAGLGAVVASATLLSTRSSGEPRERLVHITAPEVTAFAFDDVNALEGDDDATSSEEEPNLSDDEVFFEVGWPSLTEGDL